MGIILLYTVWAPICSDDLIAECQEVWDGDFLLSEEKKCCSLVKKVVTNKIAKKKDLSSSL